MSAHTPGPWRIETFKGDDLERTAIVACNGDGPVAVASFPDEGDYAANARLIAAAPDLFEACQGMVGLVQLLLSRSDLPASLREALETSHRVEHARNAIAKAAK